MIVLAGFLSAPETVTVLMGVALLAVGLATLGTWVSRVRGRPAPRWLPVFGQAPSSPLSSWAVRGPSRSSSRPSGSPEAATSARGPRPRTRYAAPMAKQTTNRRHSPAPKPELPQTREALLDLHRDTRKRRNKAKHGSPEHVEAIDLLGRIEVEIARIERAMDPPLG